MRRFWPWHYRGNTTTQQQRHRHISFCLSIFYYFSSSTGILKISNVVFMGERASLFFNPQCTCLNLINLTQPFLFNTYFRSPMSYGWLNDNCLPLWVLYPTIVAITFFFFCWNIEYTSITPIPSVSLIFFILDCCFCYFIWKGTSNNTRLISQQVCEKKKS